MKIVQINSVYPFGSTGKITADIHHLLQAHGHESYVLYGRGAQCDETNVARLCSDVYAKANTLLAEITGIPYGGCYLSTQKAINYIYSIKPDVVHLQCINEHFVNIYNLIEWLNKHQVPTVLTLHAEFMFTGNCGHAFDCERWKNECGHCSSPKKANRSLLWDRTHESFEKMEKSFMGFYNLCVVSVSPWLENRAMSSPILKGKEHQVILNGINTDVFRYRKIRKEDLFGNKKDHKIILHVSASFTERPDDPKGGRYIIELAKRFENQNVLFVVAGKYQLRSNMIPNNVLLLGEIKDQIQLASLYDAVDLTVITSRRETYSMVCAESLCCGTAVIGFQAGGPETICIPEYSEFVQYGNVDALETATKKWLKMTNEISKSCISKIAIRKYSREKMVSAYENLYHQLSHIS